MDEGGREGNGKNLKEKKAKADGSDFTYIGCWRAVVQVGGLKTCREKIVQQFPGHYFTEHLPSKIKRGNISGPV